MKRLTRNQIETDLLAGKSVPWTSSTGKPTYLQLETPAQRRLYEFLRNSSVRGGKELPQAFISGLWTTFSEGDDPATRTEDDSAGAATKANSWRIKRLQTQNFGGIDSWNGPGFSWNLDSSSWHLEGENGSGKSSLLSAIVFAFTGKRPRDDRNPDASQESQVLGSDQKKLGSWPPLASYPESAVDLKVKPEVRAVVTLENAAGETGRIGHGLSDGKVVSYREGLPAFDDVFISTGILMPVTLSALRLGEGDDALHLAVEQLTGLDALKDIGELCSALTHSAREYRSYAKKNNLDILVRDFEASIKSAAEALMPIGVDIPKFTLEDARANEGAVVTLGLKIKQEATSHADLLKDDLQEGLDLVDAPTQRRITVAISTASEQIALGLDGLATWKQAHNLSEALTDEASQKLEDAILAAEQSIRDALASHEKATADPKYILKARAAAWHTRHSESPIEKCPLCEHAFEPGARLKDELEALRTAGPAALQSLSNNLREIGGTLQKSVAPALAKFARNADHSDPDQAIRSELLRTLGTESKYGALLRRHASLLDEALRGAPTTSLPARDETAITPVSEEHREVLEKITELRFARDLAHWYRKSEGGWSQWWQTLAPHATGTNGFEESGAALNEGDQAETLTGHLERLTASLDRAKPYATGATHLRNAVEHARKALNVQAEQKRRDEVCDALEPLKSLVALSESVARQAINDLSGRIERIVEGMHQSESLVFRSAALDRKQGIHVLGGFSPDMSLDAKLVANTSWLRTTLWAFIFALRQEAAEQAGVDPLPVWLFDDPQSTFDGAHRLGWASYVASLQVASDPAQVILATHDESFHNKLKQANLQGKEALVVRAPRTSTPLILLDGSKLEQAWAKAESDRTQSSSQKYAHEARVFLEGMLKAMLAGHFSPPGEVSVSALRDELIRLGNNRRAPWDQSSFSDLTKTLSSADLKCINLANHSTRMEVEFADAQRLARLWPSLARQLRTCFREVRTWQLVHGSGAPFSLPESTDAFPEGFGHLLKDKPLPLLGRASAFSGRISDGALDYQVSDSGATDMIRLGRHSAFRLAASTLEPVARPGDILLVREFGDPKPPALVVAVAADRLMARRFVLSEAASDVAVLTANAIDPYAIASPLVANAATIKLKQIVGVLFDRPDSVDELTSHELVVLRSESDISSLLAQCAGLVEVRGQSAQPLALDGQFLLLGLQSNDHTELSRLEGSPVIALDSNQQWFFKRLRLAGDGLVILESLDGAGEYPPEIMWLDDPEASSRRTLLAVRAVLGVLFERPGATVI